LAGFVDVLYEVLGRDEDDEGELRHVKERVCRGIARWYWMEEFRAEMATVVRRHRVSAVQVLDVAARVYHAEGDPRMGDVLDEEDTDVE
jgi:predicted nucleic acid-binding protein